jgi:hypothetical protein
VVDLLRRAWDALDSFKQTYPESWFEEDELILKELSRADLQLSGVKLKWVGLTDEELIELSESGLYLWELWKAIEAKLREKNT